MNDDRTIPYASQAQRGLTGRDLFGVVARTLGLLIFLWAVYCALYLLGILWMDAPSGGTSPATYAVMSAAYALIGLSLLKCDWLLRFAYGPSGD